MAAVRSAFPEAFEAMRLSANEVRGFLKSTGRSRTDFQAQGYETLDQIPVISIGRPEFMKACEHSQPSCSARFITNTPAA